MVHLVTPSALNRPIFLLEKQEGKGAGIGGVASTMGAAGGCSEHGMIRISKVSPGKVHELAAV